MTARNKNDLRSLIEEARELAYQAYCSRYKLAGSSALRAMDSKFDQVLSLLPDADESASNWQEFDPTKKETFPKRQGEYLVTKKLSGEIIVTTDIWDSNAFPREWGVYGTQVLAYRPLPPPHVKP